MKDATYTSGMAVWVEFKKAVLKAHWTNHSENKQEMKDGTVMSWSQVQEKVFVKSDNEFTLPSCHTTGYGGRKPIALISRSTELMLIIILLYLFF